MQPRRLRRRRRCAAAPSRPARTTGRAQQRRPSSPSAALRRRRHGGRRSRSGGGLDPCALTCRFATGERSAGRAPLRRPPPASARARRRGCGRAARRRCRRVAARRAGPEVRNGRRAPSGGGACSQILRSLPDATVSVRWVYSTRVSLGRVISQRPAARTRVGGGAVVHLTVSKGTPFAEVPGVLVGASAPQPNGRWRAPGFRVLLHPHAVLGPSGKAR